MIKAVSVWRLGILGVMMLCVCSVHGQTPLKRGAFLGVFPVTTVADEPVNVRSLHPEGTGAALGLRVADRVASVNGQPVKDFDHLVSLLSDVSEGTQLSVTVLRDDQTIRLTGEARSRPKEQNRGYRVYYDAFDWRNNLIRTITYQPDTQRADKAGVMFVQGYTCDSIDYGMLPEITLTQLLAAYARAGFTVFKMEKPGVGDSTGPLSCADFDFDTENAAFIAGLRHFASSKRVNADNVFVFGHSLGVLHAAIMARQGLARGVMGYGGVLKPWHQYLEDIYTKQATTYFGTSKSRAADNVKTVAPFLRHWLTTDQSWQEMTQDTEVQQALASGLIPVNGEQVFDRHYRFFRSLNRHDFTDHWSHSQSHVLLMHGGYDIQAIEENWAHDIAALVNRAGQKTAQARVFARTDHSLLRYPDISALRQRSYSAANPGDSYNPDIAATSLAWMQQLLTAAPQEAR